MQIIFKENDNGNLCLFDTRSELFFTGGCVKSAESGADILSTANDIVKKPTKSIIEIADSGVYTDNGYLEAILAIEYLKLNPDLRIANKEKLQLKKDKKTQMKEPGRGRGRPKKK